MNSEDKYFKTLTEPELWQRYCSYFDLSVGEFKEIQEHLLIDEINLVADSLLGKKLMGNKKPATVEEFRRNIPLTMYADYEPYLSERREDALAIKPIFWCHSAGKGGNFKWLPYSSEAITQFYRLYIGCMILAVASRKGEVKIKPWERLLLTAAPRPYASGHIIHQFSQAFSIRIMPPLEEAERMSFPEKVQRGFQLSLRNGVDEIFSISSVLVKLGERMTQQAHSIKLSLGMLYPRVLFTLITAWLRSKIDKRPILPKDLWRAKAILTGGTDAAIYKDDIIYYWGKKPFEMYVSTEAPIIGLHYWNKKLLTPIPLCAFWEFIPEEESFKSREGNNHQPATVLLDELEAGKIYEVVLTQFYGMPLLRYRLGDLIQVIALSDDDTGVRLPQFVFHGRVGDTIDLAGLTRLTERVIWQAIANSGVKYEEWSACKEYNQNKTSLRLYLELKEEREIDEIERLIDEQLKILDVDYKDIDSYLELQPVKVTLLHKGTFERYYQEKVKEGADLAHLKPPHMNAPEAVTQRLLELSTTA